MHYRFGNWLALLIATALIVACSPAPVVPLPPVPVVDAEGYLPAIQAQIDAAVAAVSARPDDPDANGELARVMHAYSQFEPAVVLYTRAAALDRKPGVWLYLKGQSLAALGRTSEAIDALGAAREARSDDPWIAGTHTLMRRMSGDRTASARELEALLGSHARLPELRYTLARMYALEGNLDQAIKEFERSLSLAGPFGAAYYGLGMAHMRRGDAQRAEEFLALSQQFKDVVAQGSDPHLAAIEALNLSDIRLIQRAEKALLSGDLAEAARLLNLAVERNPASVAAHLSLLGVYSNTGQFELAERHYEAARALEPERAKLFYNLGLLRMMQQRYVEAERAFRESIQRESSADAYTQLAIVQVAQKQPGLARLSLNRAVEIDPTNRFARLQLAQMHKEAKNLDGVVTALEGHYEPVDGGSAHMLLLLARTYNEQGDAEKALHRATLGLEVAQRWQQTALINQFKRQQYLAKQEP